YAVIVIVVIKIVPGAIPVCIHLLSRITREGIGVVADAIAIAVSPLIGIQRERIHAVQVSVIVVIGVSAVRCAVVVGIYRRQDGNRYVIRADFAELVCDEEGERKLCCRLVGGRDEGCGLE